VLHNLEARNQVFQHACLTFGLTLIRLILFTAKIKHDTDPLRVSVRLSNQVFRLNEIEGQGCRVFLCWFCDG